MVMDEVLLLVDAQLLAQVNENGVGLRDDELPVDQIGQIHE